MATGIFIPSGAGAPGFGGILQCLNQAGYKTIAAGDKDPNAYGKGLLKNFVTMPASDSSEYLQQVILQAKAFHCNVLLPITTGELGLLSENLELLQNSGLHLAITPYPQLLVANNKRLLYEFLQDHGQQTPQFRIAENKNQLLAQLRHFDFPLKPVFMKPSSGNGSRGIKMIVGLERLRDCWFDTKSGGMVTSVEALELEIPETFPAEYLLCEYLPGTEYSVDILAEKGEMLLCLPRIRRKTVSGISVAGSFLQHPALTENCKKICHLLSLHGPIGIQFKEDENGIPKILEINPRLQGAVSTCLMMGSNIPALSVELALGNPLTIQPPNFELPASFGRFWQDVPLF